MQNNRISTILKDKNIGADITVKGWVRSCRTSKNVAFIDLTDGSCLQGLQVVADNSLENFSTDIRQLNTGASLAIQGKLVASPAKGQDFELQVSVLEVIGNAADTYPLQKKCHSFEFLREIAHLRPRTNTLGAVSRVRSALSFAVHSFFNEQGFVYVHTPIISTSDCEGAGETFTVTSFDLDNILKTNGKTDWKKDFFDKQANLTVSGQLEAEAYALALGNVYTFGPTFRAEDSNTSRHLAEFWMIEPEMAFCDLDGDIKVAEDFLKYLIQYCLDHCCADLEFFSKFIDKTLFERLEDVLKKPFTRLSYSEAVELLLKSGQDFSFPVKWGIDLQSEHERFLTEHIKGPVVLTDYPTAIKPFYVHQNDDKKTVAAMDILFPGIGEIIGGSQREERLEILEKRMAEQGINSSEYQWYLDLRRYGSVPHAGFGLGFERIILFITGMKNIRDVIPFPRTPGSAA